MLILGMSNTVPLIAIEMKPPEVIVAISLCNGIFLLACILSTVVQARYSEFDFFIFRHRGSDSHNFWPRMD